MILPIKKKRDTVPSETYGENEYLSRDGYRFNYQDSRWRLSKVKIVSFEWMISALDKSLHENYKKVMLHYAQNNAPNSCAVLSYNTRLFFEFCMQNDGKIVDFVHGRHVLNYFSSLKPNKKHFLGRTIPFLKKWSELGYEGISDEALDAIKELRIKGSERGKAVKILCPYEGPLSDLEYEGLCSALSREFEKGNVSLEEMLITELFLATGRRPSQISHLKVKDFLGVTASGGQVFNLLRIPKVKQKTLWRREFTDYALSPELGDLIGSYISQLEKKALKISPLNEAQLSILPLFPSWKKLKSVITEDGYYHLNKNLEADPLHLSPGEMSEKLKKVVSSLNLISERTGEPIKIFPTRLRRTLASRAAREGYGVIIIARLLDHADTQSAHIYTENTPEHLTNIDKAMALQLAPIAQAFSGTLVSHEKYAKRGGELSSRIKNTSHGEGVGTCGTHSFCTSLSPIACYTCHHFQPWLDGPHEAILEELIEKRKEILKRTQDKTIASVNDRTIFAVSEVVRMCSIRKEGMICDQDEVCNE